LQAIMQKQAWSLRVCMPHANEIACTSSCLQAKMQRRAWSSEFHYATCEHDQARPILPVSIMTWEMSEILNACTPRVNMIRHAPSCLWAIWLGNVWYLEPASANGAATQSESHANFLHASPSATLNTTDLVSCQAISLCSTFPQSMQV